MKKKAFVIAYTAMNLGDDLFIKFLIERYKNVKFYIYSPKIYRKIYKSNSNIICLPIDSFINRVMCYMLRCMKSNENVFHLNFAKFTDVIINIGGSLFIEDDDWKSIKQHREKIESLQKPVFLLGCNFGPFYSSDYFNYYRQVFSKYADVTFRDKYSYNLFSDLKNTRLADDVVFALHDNSIYDSKKIVIISVIDLSWRNTLLPYLNQYEMKICELSEFYCNEGYQVYLTSFCEAEGDASAAERIYANLNENTKKNTKRLYYKWDIEEVLSIFKQSEIIIATRFHAMIIGFAYNKTVTPIIYSGKIVSVLHDMNYSGLRIDMSEIGNITPDFIFSEQKSNKQVIDIEEIARRSSHHFDILDDFLS